MKLQPVNGSSQVRFAIEGVAKNRVADCLHVEAQLMASPGLRIQQNARGVVFEMFHLPRGQGGAAGLEADFLERPVGPVSDDREFDDAVRKRHSTPYPRNVGLFNDAIFELATEMPLCVRRQCENRDPGGVAVKAVDEQRRGHLRLNTREEAVPQCVSFPGHRQQSRRLADDQQMVVDVDEFQGRLRRIVIRSGPRRAKILSQVPGVP